MTERTQRDAFERLQVEARGLETELSLEHAPAFVEQRDALQSSLAKEKQVLSEHERDLSSARTQEAEVEGRVHDLQAQLKALAQRRLDVLPLLLLGGVLITLLSLQPVLPLAPTGFALSAMLGLLFGPRLFSRRSSPVVVPEASGPEAPSMLGRLVGAFALLGLAAPGAWGAMSDLIDAGRGLPLSADGAGPAIAGFFAICGTLVALKGAATHPVRAERITQKVFAGLGLGMYSLLLARWAPPYFRELHLGETYFTGHSAHASLISLCAPALPFLVAIRSRWAPMKSDGVRLNASLITVAFSWGLVFWMRRSIHELDSVLSVASLALQLGFIAYALAMDLSDDVPRLFRWALRLSAFLPLLVPVFF